MFWGSNKLTQVSHLREGVHQDMSCGLYPALCLFWKIVSLDHSHTHSLPITYGCFLTTTVKLSTCYKTGQPASLTHLFSANTWFRLMFGKNWVLNKYWLAFVTVTVNVHIEVLGNRLAPSFWRPDTVHTSNNLSFSHNSGVSHLETLLIF